MKNYNEMANDVLRRIGEHETEQRNRRKTISRIVTPLCCFCLVALLGFGMWKGGMFDAKPPITLDDSINIGEKDYINPDELDNTQTTIPGNNDSQNNNQTGSEQKFDPAEIIWTINRVEGQVGAAKLNFSTDKYYSEKKTLTDIVAYLGRDLSKLESVMSQGFELYGSCESDFYYELDGDMAYDSCFFGYKRDEQYITVKVSKIGVPYDCLYMLNNPTVSNINGVEVTVGGIYKADNTGELELIFADFSHGGLQYRVTIENVPSDDYMYLNSIIGELTR